jgi:exosortase A
MPPEAALPLEDRAGWVAPIPQAWRTPLLRLALAWVGLAAFFADDWADMAAQWWNSSTYNHILLVPPIIAWLVWMRRGEVSKLTPSAWWPGLVLLAGALFLWLLGAFSGLNLARQLGAVLALQAVTATLLGPRVIAGLFFPVCYALFLVPFGDELVPLLQTITAKLTIAFTHWSGIPAEIEGVFIDTPAGLFEVAEACSGVKFLIAMIALAALVAQVCFKSWLRRFALMAFAIVLPIVANGIRAWGTIYIAQFQGVEFAASFDHIFYGWIFFALVMAILLAVAWRFFDRSADDPLTDSAAIEASPVVSRLAAFGIGGWTALGGIAGLGLAFALWFGTAFGLKAPLPEAIELPQVAGWEQVPIATEIWWEPRARGAGKRLLGRYRDAEGREVDVFVALYAAQREGSEAGGFGEGALMPESDWRWLEPGPAIDGANSEMLMAYGRIHRLAATFYRTGDLLSGSNARLKLATMQDKLLLRARPTMLLVLSADDSDARPAAESIAAFRASAGELGAWMDGIARLP